MIQFQNNLIKIDSQYGIIEWIVNCKTIVMEIKMYFREDGIFALVIFTYSNSRLSKE